MLSSGTNMSPEVLERMKMELTASTPSTKTIAFSGGMSCRTVTELPTRLLFGGWQRLGCASRWKERGSGLPGVERN